MLRATAFVLATASTALLAQTAGAPDAFDPGQALGACHVSPIVANLDNSAKFYHELIGLNLYPEQRPGPLPWDTDPGHLDIQGRGFLLDEEWALQKLHHVTGAMITCEFSCRRKDPPPPLIPS